MTTSIRKIAADSPCVGGAGTAPGEIVMNEVYATFFRENRPARTTVAVADLPKVAEDSGFIVNRKDSEQVVKRQI